MLFGFVALSVVAQEDKTVVNGRNVDEYNRHYSTAISNNANGNDIIDVQSGTDEDDMYFIPQKTKKKKNAKSAFDDDTPAYYVGSNCNVDEYNRHKKLVSTYQKIGSDSLGNDIIRIFSNNEIYPDTSYVDTLFMISKYVNNDDDYLYSSRLSRWGDYYYNIPYDIWRNYSWWGYRPYSWPAYMYGRSWAWHFHGGYYGWGYGFFDPWYDPLYWGLYYGGYFDPYYLWGYPWWYGSSWYYTGAYYGGGYGGYGGYGRHNGGGSTTTSGRGDIRYTGVGTYNHSRSSGGIGGSVHSSSNRNIFSRTNSGSSSGFGSSSRSSSNSTTRTYTTNSSGVRFGGSGATNYNSSSRSYSAPTSSYSGGSSSGSSYSSSSGGSSFGGSSGGGGGRSGGGSSGGGSVGGGGGRSGGGSFGGHR